MSAIVAGFVLGLAGSGHCALMCGPLTLALHGSGARTRLAFVLHHAGRLTMYGLGGALAGALGRAAGFAGLGRAAAIALGVVMLAQAVIGSRGNSDASVAIGRGLGRVMRHASRIIGPRPRLLAFVVGALNGLLPCGMVYAALAASVALGSAGHAALFMIAFGAGAMPSLAALHAATPLVPGSLRRHAPLVTRLALIVLGATLVFQGLRAAPAANAGSPDPASAPHAHHHTP
jgi:sulfite exporter TauE/SafE